MRARLRLTASAARLLAVCGVPATAAAGLLGFFLYSSLSTPAAAAAPVAMPVLPPTPGLLVHVSGAVAHPGLYRLSRGDRVYTAVEAAGGLTGEADPDRLPDLAGRLRDGQQVKVPFARRGASAARTPKIDLNRATAEQLATVPGVSPELAAAVVQYRSEYGPFSSTRQLVTLLGMGAANYALARGQLAVVP
jgi:competence protein ComEA